MLSLVSDVLDVERFENGNVRLQPSSTDLRALLEGEIALGREVAKGHGIGFEGRIGEGVPRLVEVDWTRLIQAINNVINNWFVWMAGACRASFLTYTECSIRHTPAGGHVNLLVDADPFANRGTDSTPSQGTSRSSQRGQSRPAAEDEIAIDMAEFPSPKHEEDKTTLVIRCSDTNGGMDKERIDNLFQPYVLATAMERKEYSGSGLGEYRLRLPRLRNSASTLLYF
jgi:signal transduction histidine kinase